MANLPGNSTTAGHIMGAPVQAALNNAAVVAAYPPQGVAAGTTLFIPVTGVPANSQFFVNVAVDDTTHMWAPIALSAAPFNT